MTLSAPYALQQQGLLPRLFALLFGCPTSHSDKSAEELQALFSEVMRNYNDMIMRICLGYSNSVDDFNDLRQDALTNIWHSLPAFRGDSSLKTWVYRITLNTCVSTLRSRSRSPHKADITEVYNIADGDIEQRQQMQEVYECISQLNAVQKAIMMLWLDGYNYDEIAATTGVPRNTVASNLHRAKLTLKSRFNNNNTNLNE